MPVVIWLIARFAFRFRMAFLLRFFEGFCLVMNVAFLTAAIAVSAGDTADLLRLGVPVWMPEEPGVVMVVARLFALCVGIDVY